MGNAKIWWYPDPLGTVEELDLGEPLSDLEDEPQRDQSVTESLTGAATSVNYSARGRYRIERSRIMSAGVAASLEAFRNHAQRGGHFSLAEDSAKALAIFVTPPARGATSLAALGIPWPYNGVTTITGSDYCRLQSPSPNRFEELVLPSGVYTASGTLAPVTLSAGVKFDYQNEGWALLSWRGFYPVLRLPPRERNQVMFRHDRRLTWSLDFFAEEDPYALEAFAGSPDLPVSTGTTTLFRGLEPQAHRDTGVPDFFGGG